MVGVLGIAWHGSGMVWHGMVWRGMVEIWYGVV